MRKYMKERDWKREGDKKYKEQEPQECEGEKEEEEQKGKPKTNCTTMKRRKEGGVERYKERNDHLAS